MSDSTKDTWVQWVAMTTVVLAVCASIGSLKAGSYSTRATLTTTDENNRWAHFQAKSIKQHTCETQLTMLRYYQLSAATPAAKAYLQEQITKAQADIARYEREKKEISDEATSRSHDEEVFKRRGASMSLAVMLLQIAIMLSSVSALIKRRPLWLVGLGVGGVGLVFMLNAFALWF